MERNLRCQASFSKGLTAILWAIVSKLPEAVSYRQENAVQREVSRTDINQQAERILDQYGNSILRYAYTYLHNRDDAEEILQDTLVQFLKTAPVFENEQHEKAWLLRVAGNLSKSRIVHITSGEKTRS